VTHTTPQFAVIGAGPAGLMAAEILAPHGKVIVLDRMPSPGRKFLMAGRGGLNLTHGEPLDRLLARYETAQTALIQAIAAHPPQAVIDWCHGLGQDTFVGSSGRVFPRAMKASPLLRAWLARLDKAGVTLRTRQEWRGWNTAGALMFEGPDGAWTLAADATVLALGGASWPRLGADGGWTSLLPNATQPWRPANMGFATTWSDRFRERFAGTPLKRIGLSVGPHAVLGETMITAQGLEGGAVYALSAPIRDTIEADGPTVVHIDLRPDLTQAALATRLRADRGSQSLSNFLRSKAGLSPVAIGLVQEALHAGPTPPLAEVIKAVPVRLLAPAPIGRAISSAGGLSWAAIDERLMLRARPGTFAAGEMLDWEAPTGGYLLQACFSTGVAAANGALAWLREHA
jgi:uncharacterized flavoprotein (TIGR03862 family)